MKRPQLFLLHFAGGNSYSFQFLVPFLKEFDIISLELPGRGRRTNESFLKDFDLAAMDIYNQLTRQLTSSSFLIYGHSMGAYLALRVSSMLEKVNKFPACLIVSGNPGPGVGVSKNRHLLEHKDFIGELKRLGGIPTELFENKELLDFFMPILRADFEITEKNGLTQEAVVDAPIYAMMGSQENKVEKISNWANYTRSHFNFKILEGDHFFIYKYPKEIADIIKKCYDNCISLRYQQKPVI